MRLIVGLGNPGREYEASRHNVGFRCLDELAARHHIDLSRRAFKSLVGSGDIAGERVILAKPQTYMNLSGEAVAPLARYYGIPLEHLLVIYDDMDLPLGRIRLRERGSSGGHNGLNSIIAHVGSDQFPRLRIGIGRPLRATARDFVLSRFDKEEEAIAEESVKRAADAVEMVLREGIAAAMNTFNAR